MKSKLLLPFLLSFFSFPLGHLLRCIYFVILPAYGDAGVALISIVISLNVSALILTLHQLHKGKL